MSAGPSLDWVRHGLHWLFPDRRDVFAALAIVAGVWISNSLGVLALTEDLAPQTIVEYLAHMVSDTFLWMVPVYLTARWSAGWALAGWHRHVAVAAVLAAGLVAAAIYWQLVEPHPLAEALGVTYRRPAISMSIAALWFPIGLLLAAQFHRSQQERTATGRLQSALREQQAAQRRFALAQLQTLQSRIDPRFLFDMLQHIRHAYESDPARAEAMLEDLIVFLRTVLPKVMNDVSTLGREADIASQYARLVAAAQPAACELRLSIKDGLAGRPFPPAVLLPLVSDLLQQRAASKGAIELAAAMAANGCVVTLRSPKPPREAALSLARAALEQTCGDADAVRVLALPDGAVVTLRTADDLA